MRCGQSGPTTSWTGPAQADELVSWPDDAGEGRRGRALSTDVGAGRWVLGRRPVAWLGSGLRSPGWALPVLSIEPGRDAVGDAEPPQRSQAIPIGTGSTRSLGAPGRPAGVAAEAAVSGLDGRWSRPEPDPSVARLPDPGLTRSSGASVTTACVGCGRGAGPRPLDRRLPRPSRRHPSTAAPTAPWRGRRRLDDDDRDDLTTASGPTAAPATVDSTTVTSSSTGAPTQAATPSAEATWADDGGGRWAGGPNGSSDGLEALRNLDPRFGRYAVGARQGRPRPPRRSPSPPRSRTTGRSATGSSGRPASTPHFGYDDPIVYPGQPGRSHLHMYFGNTEVDAFTTTERLVDSERGRDVQRVRAQPLRLLDPRPARRTRQRGRARDDHPLLQVQAARPGPADAPGPEDDRRQRGPTRTASRCRTSSSGRAATAATPTTSRTGSPIVGVTRSTPASCSPQCWDGVNLDSADHRSHMALVSPHADCPSGATRPGCPRSASCCTSPASRRSRDGDLSSDRTDGFGQRDRAPASTPTGGVAGTTTRWICGSMAACGRPATVPSARPGPIGCWPS